MRHGVLVLLTALVVSACSHSGARPPQASAPGTVTPSPPPTSMSSPAAAGSSPSPLPESLCDGTTVDMQDCLARVLDGLNRQLATTYTRVRRDLVERAAEGAFTVETADPPFTVHPVEELSASERLFLRYRESLCQTAYDAWIGGTIRGLNALGCEIALTRQQISQVEALADP